MQKRWNIIQPNLELQRELTKDLEISSILAQILINRNITDISSARFYLSSTLSDLYSPWLMKDMDEAVNRIITAISRNEKICIYGDYDVDGITSISILILFLKNLNLDTIFYIPERLKEGYGLNINAIDKIISQGAKLLITCDCGISNFDEVKYATNSGLDVIIVDHHEVPNNLPPALATLNPKQRDCNFPFKNLSAVGVVFNLLIALRSKLRDIGYFKDSIPNLKDYLDIVAIGTIGDIAPLLDENRIFTKYGLDLLKTSNKPGIIALKEVCGLQGKSITTRVVGYRIAPRLNAAGRLERADLAVKLLTTNNEDEAKTIVKTLDKENSERQQIEDRILKEAKILIESEPQFKTKKSIVLFSDKWHPGVIGIVASKLMDEYYKPTILLSLKDGIAKGSARSIPGLHIYEALNHCNEVLDKYGGHSQAAGLTLSEDNISRFIEFFEDITRVKLKEENFIPTINVDAEIRLSNLTENLMKEINKLEPYGTSNPEPLFYVNGIKIIDSKIVGKDHLKLKIFETKTYWDAIGFGLANHFPLPSSTNICAIFYPELNEWNGNKRIQLKIRDIKAE